MNLDKKKAIENLIEVFTKGFPRRNHVILVDMSTGSYSVGEMLSQEIIERVEVRGCCREWST